MTVEVVVLRLFGGVVPTIEPAGFPAEPLAGVALKRRLTQARQRRPANFSKINR